jgi:hypothetical protein
MSGPVMSFRADSLDPRKLEQILSRYLAYERLRLFRARIVPRFGALLLACWLLTSELELLPGIALLTAIILVGITVGIAVATELTARQRLVRELRDSRG